MPNVPTQKALNKFEQSYAKLLKQTGIPREQWSRYFNDKQNPTWETLEHIAEALELDFLDCVAAFLDKRARILAAKAEADKST